MPKLLIRVDDLAHEGADVFFGAVNAKEALNAAVMASFKWLYTLEDVPRNVKQISLILRSMDGVAHTTGSKAHKEIHYSLDYIKATKHRARDEIMGVLVHEVVHCYQYDGHGSCPGGLIEGMADYVRLQADLGPPHWKPKGGKWDMGYDGTAYFLNWIEQKIGKGTVRKLNACMKGRKYHEKMFEDLCGKSVDTLWMEYCATLGDGVTPPPQEEEPAVNFIVQQDK
ncbi:plant basic secretory protein [Pholiota conissans]|uniref:Plant basic secretory protein n=1 Tax=Pholiota conissans TaxID=109636 RepID=A0A9P5ZFD6_9AGAR|nr:plant basic secretory protein [Pholiota conissans]